MAKYNFLSETPTEEEGVHQYELEVVADLGEDNTETHTQTVVFKTDDLEKQAQKYADEMESELKKRYDSEQKAQKEANETASTEE